MLPSAPIGTASQGRTIEEAVANLKEATGLYLEEQRSRSRSPRYSDSAFVKVPKVVRTFGTMLRAARPATHWPRNWF